MFSLSLLCFIMTYENAPLIRFANSGRLVRLLVQSRRILEMTKQRNGKEEVNIGKRDFETI